MKVSVVIICWNDLKDILVCLQSVISETTAWEYEVIVTDNGSTDGSVEEIKKRFPTVHVLENRANLGFAGANNRAFDLARGDYVLILNPDTIIRDRAIEKMVAFADAHKEVGAIGARMLNSDGSYQRSAYPVPTIRAALMSAVFLRHLASFARFFEGEVYARWEGNNNRDVGYQAGCCILIRTAILRRLKGFDERLFFQTEDADLCLRVWKLGFPVRYFTGAEVTHIGGANRGRYPARVILETQRNFYRFYYKHYGEAAIRRYRVIALIKFGLRFLGYTIVQLFKRDPALKDRLATYRALLKWHWNVEPAKFVQTGEEPDVGHKTFAPPREPMTRWNPADA